MNTKEFLNDVCKEIKYKPANKAISEELEGHIEDIKSEYLCKGASEKEAEEKAVEEMGDAKQIGRKLNKIHRPKLDWITLIFAIAFILYGRNFWILYYSDSYWNDYSFYWRIHYRLEYIGIILGIVFSIFLYFYDYRKICKHSKFLFVFATALNIVAYIRGFRANGNLLYGLYPFTQTSPTVFSIPLYIIAFAGFMKDINAKTNIKITTSIGRTINFNIVKITTLGILSVITSLMINFVSGFLLTVVYVIIVTRELLKTKQRKNTVIFLVTSSILFGLLSIIICIVPTIWSHQNDTLTSAYWVGIDTMGERRFNFVREKTMKAAKLFGEADLEGIPIVDNETGYYFYRTYYSTTGKMAFLGILSRYGWIASLCLIIILVLFSIKLIISSIKIKDSYGKLIAIGITSLFVTQIVCNLAMNFGIIGVAEFDLPLISGGKSTIIVNILCMALFLSVYRRKDINFEEPKKSKIITAIEDFFFEESTIKENSES